MDIAGGGVVVSSRARVYAAPELEWNGRMKEHQGLECGEKKTGKGRTRVRERLCPFSSKFFDEDKMIRIMRHERGLFSLSFYDCAGEEGGGGGEGDVWIYVGGFVRSAFITTLSPP